MSKKSIGTPVALLSAGMGNLVFGEGTFWQKAFQGATLGMYGKPKNPDAPTVTPTEAVKTVAKSRQQLIAEEYARKRTATSQNNQETLGTKSLLGNA